MTSRFHGTTICCVRRDGQVALAGDGQVTLGNTVMKFTRFESKLEAFSGNLHRAAVELASEWRTDKTLRHLEALLVVASEDASVLLSGTGDVIEPDDGVLVIGSGGPVALAAARTLLRHTELDASSIAREALEMAAAIDIYTNDSIVVETLPAP